MSNEIHTIYEPGENLYMFIRTVDGQILIPSDGRIEQYGSGGHTAADYAIEMEDKLGSLYLGQFPTDIPPGRYLVQVFIRSGPSPSDYDRCIGLGQFIFSGSAELSCDKILINKATQDKLTGRITYYDDDGQTVLFAHQPQEDESTITRQVE